MNARNFILPLILIVTTSFSAGVNASTRKNADAQAQAAALLRRERVAQPAHFNKSDAAQRVIVDAHRQAAALLLGQGVRSSHSIRQTKRGSARRESDAQAQAAALLGGSRAR